MPLFSLFSLEDSAYAIQSGKYKMLDFPVNIRSQPSLSGNIIGRLQLHDEIEVIENMGNEQRIDGVLQNWYKIKFNEIIGFIWGGYISLNTWTFEMKNNKNILIYYRITSVINKDVKNMQPDDIFIYINNKRVPTNTFKEIYYRYKFHEGGYWNNCFIYPEQGKDSITIGIECIKEDLVMLLFIRLV
jgi:hypothetical protein